jgi:hypothetical protein
MSVYQINKKLTFWLLPSPKLREFPKQVYEKIETKHINGGYTYPSENIIFIFRREEFPKVLLHETLHHARIDTDKLWKPEHLTSLYEYFNISTSGCLTPSSCHTDLRPNEAIIEALAEIHHTAFLSYEYRISFKRMIMMEQKWACVQAKRILQRQRNRQWSEGTHAFSYMVIRACLLCNADTFLEYIMTTPKIDSDRLVHMIRSSFENQQFQSKLTNTVIPTHHSLRMTVWGDM